MRIAFPVKEDRGLDSMIDEHFGVAEKFLLVDTETGQLELKTNQKVESGKTSCKSGIFAKEDRIEAVITNCMGDGSQRNLHSSNIRVYQASDGSVRENLEAFKRDELKLFHMFDLCQDKKNKKEGGCGHHH